MNNSNQTLVCQLNNVSKSYRAGGPVIVSGLTLSIYQGEILGLSGDNGAGKSTVLGMIAGSIRPSSGTITYSQTASGHIGYVPQEISLYESLTGMENLRFWGIAQGMSAKAIKARCNWLLQQVDLTDKASTRVCDYSGGMKRRLHLASALMVRPELLLLDEPTVGADATSREVILNLISHMKALGTSVVIVTHEQGELEKISDRIIRL